MLQLAVKIPLEVELFRLHLHSWYSYRLATQSSSILAHRKFVKRAILIISAPAATRVYACLVISARDIPHSTRGNANAWCVAWGKSGGKTSANLAVSTRFWRNAT